MAQIDPKLKKKIKKDYMKFDLSLRDLSVKYGVSKSAVCSWINQEGWRVEKASYIKEAEEKAREDEWTDAGRILDHLAERAVSIYESADLLLKKVNELLKLPDALSPRDLKSLSSTLLDIKMIHDIRPVDEIYSRDNEIKVTIVGGGGLDA